MNSKINKFKFKEDCYYEKQLADNWNLDYHKEELVFGVDGNIYRNGKLLAEEPTYEQKKWVIRKMKAPEYTWRSYV